MSVCPATHADRIRRVLLCVVLATSLVLPAMPATALSADLHGNITDADSHAGLAGVEVSVFDSNEEYVADTVSNASGDYYISSLPENGTYYVDFSKEGYAYETVEVVYTGSPQTVDVQLQALEVVATGTITSSFDGAPIEEAWVFVESTTGSDFWGYAMTDAAGHYTLYDEAQIGADSITFYVDAYGFKSAERNVTWNGTDVLVQDFVLEELFPWTGELETVPLEGDNRYETAVKGSQMAFPKPGSCDSVVIASGENFPDALGGSALAGALHCPVLLTKPGELSSVSAAEVKRLGAKTAWIIGGPAAVSELIPASLKNYGVTSQRIAGATRYETAALVAEKTVDVLGLYYTGDVMFATGENFPDALAASPIAAYAGTPILLVRTDAVPSATMSAVKKLDPFFGTVLGGESAVGPTAYDELESFFGEEGLLRLAGNDRYETAAIVAEFGADVYGLSWGGTGFATGEKFPDALAGGAAQGLMSTVMLLTKTNSVPAAVTDTIDTYGDQMNELHFFGGTAAISSGVRTQITSRVERMH